MEWIGDMFLVAGELFGGTVIEVAAKIDAAIDDFKDWLSIILITGREENGK